MTQRPTDSKPISGLTPEADKELADALTPDGNIQSAAALEHGNAIEPSNAPELSEDLDLDSDEDLAGGEELYERLRLVADKGQELTRIDKWLCNLLPHTSRSRVQQAADEGHLHVNGKAVKSNYRVHPLDVVTLMMDHPRYDTTIEAEDLPLDVVYEDEAVMVVNKAAGMVVHPGCGNYHGTLVNAIAWHLKDHPSYDPNDPEVGLVHRIDKDTSGLLVAAKTADAKSHLGKQFFHHTARRSYKALVWGHFADDGGTIEGNIGRDPKDRLRMAVFPAGSDTGKEAVTHYRVVERFGYVTLVECVLETGRTHQIRAHMRHIGHPLFGDERYGGTEILRGNRTGKYKQFVENCLALCPRQALHAQTLGFTHPTTGKPLDFSSELPDDLERLIDKWRRYVASSTTHDNSEI